MDTTLIDKMFPESPNANEELDICRKIMYLQKDAVNQMYEPELWEELGMYCKKFSRFDKWGNHFLEVSHRINKRNNAREAKCPTPSST